VKTKQKHSVSILLLIIFAANISGAMSFWHITMEGGCEHHDSDHCPVCLGILINSSQMIIPSAMLFSSDIMERQVECVYDIPSPLQTIPKLIPRAPPAA